MTSETVVPPQTGPAALLAALRAVDLDALEAKARLELKDGKVSKRDQAIKLLNVIEGLRRNKTKPEELLITKVPVLPAQFRPFSSVGGTFIPGDANELYGDLLKVQKGYRQLRESLGENGVGRERLTVYGAIKALYGYGDPVQPKTKERGVSGFMKHVAGSSPKFGWVQRRLISKPVDTVSRGVIVVNPELSLNEINIPEDSAWSQYAPHIERLLRQQGLPKIQALKQIKDRGDLAKRALQRLTTPGKEGIPVTYSRAPAWHKFNLVAGWPKIVPGDMIAVNPYVTAGLNADFDGDQMNVHVPATDEEIEEAKERLMPDKMLFSIKSPDATMPQPKHESVLGFFAANQRPATQRHQFNTRAEALDAINKGAIPLHDDVEILDEEDTPPTGQRALQ